MAKPRRRRVHRRILQPGRVTTSSLRLPDRPTARRLALTVAMVLPTVITWLYFVQLAEAATGTQQAVYAIGKIVQFALPVAFVALVLRKPPRISGLTRRGWYEGLISGLVACAGALGLVWVVGRVAPDLMTALGEQVRAKVVGLGISSLPRYVAVAVFYSLVHSALEEYYWRWFVYGQLRRFLRARPAIWLGALAFMAHHVILVGFYTGWGWSASLPLALAVGVGGAYWSWLYERSGSLIGPWISHLLIDAAIFAVGWLLVLSAPV